MSTRAPFLRKTRKEWAEYFEEILESYRHCCLDDEEDAQAVAEGLAERVTHDTTRGLALLCDNCVFDK